MEEENYTPYCEECTSCGEMGCCPPTMIHEGCKYFEIQAAELKSVYCTWSDFNEWIYNQRGRIDVEEIQAKLEEFEEKNDKIFYNHETE